MVTNISFGQYIPIESQIHQLDPRTKIFITLILLTAAFKASFLGLGILYILGLALIIKSRIGMRYYIQQLRPFRFIIAISMLLQWTLTKGIVLARVGPIEITAEGACEAALLGARLVFILLTVSISTFTTTPMSTIGGLEKLLKPLGKIGFPLHEMVMIMTISLRFIPLFFEESKHIITAQMCRGVDYREGNLIKRIKRLVSILVPLFHLSFQRANDLALAMESRGYRGGEGRSHLNQLKMTMTDYLVMAVVTIIAGLLLIPNG
jgi:energy-coupling factor transport system permease protein